MSGLEQIALNAVVVVGLYFFISVRSMAKRRGAIVAFLWMLDCWDWTVDCGRSDALLYFYCTGFVGCGARGGE